MSSAIIHFSVLKTAVAVVSMAVSRFCGDYTNDLAFAIAALMIGLLYNTLSILQDLCVKRTFLSSLHNPHISGEGVRPISRRLWRASFL